MQENEKVKKIYRYVMLICGMMAIFCVVYFIDNLICQDILEVSNRLTINENWNVTINGKLYENVKLDEFTFETVMKDDVVTIETTLPSDMEFKEACICINNCHTVVSMYVDGKLEFEYGHDRYEKKEATGSGFMFVNFYDEYKGKQIRLEYIVVEDSAFSSFEAPWISEWNHSFRYVLTTNRLPLLMGSFLVVMGILTIMVQIFTLVFSKKYSKVMFLSMFSICIGIWTLCYYDIMLLFAIPLYKVSLMEYVSLFLSPIPIMSYMHEYIKETRQKKILIIYKVLLSMQITITTVALSLHALDLVHGVRMLKFFLAIVAVQLLFVAFVLIRGARSKEMKSKLAIIGLIIVVIAIGYESAAYAIQRFFGMNNLELKGFASLGVTIFIGLLLIDLYQKVTVGMMEEKEKGILVKLAYTDELTKLYNRTYCTGHMREISVNKKADYTIINFDLNGLKKINDTYGHIKGDELICYAAIVLDKTFSTEGVVGRMGGDEFIAIIENVDVEYIEQLLEKFKENIQDVNRMKPDLGLSISYGYATSTELEGETSEKVYHVADERMYAYKQKVKAQALSMS